MARPEHVQQLDRQVAAAVERAVRGVREQFGGRLRQASDELLKLLQESTPDVPQSFIHEDDLSPIVALARAEGRAEGVREMHSGFSRIDRAQTQSEALEALLQAATLFSSRAALFLTRPEGAHGWAGFGFGESAATLSTVEISYADAPWARLAEGRGSVELDAADCARLCGRLEASAPRDGVLIPLVLRDQVAAALYADRLTESSRLDVEALQALTQSAALAIETLPFRSRTSTPTLRLAEASAPALGLWQPEVSAQEDAAVQAAPWSAPLEEIAPVEAIEEAHEDLYAEPDASAPAAGFSFSEPEESIQPEAPLSWSAFTPEPSPEVAEEAAPSFLSTAPLPVEPESDLFEPAAPVELAAPAFEQPAEAVAEEVWVLDDSAAAVEPDAMELVGGFDLPSPAAPAPEAIAWTPEPEPELFEPLPAPAPASTQMFTLEPSAAATPPATVLSAPPETTAAIDLSEDQTLLLERQGRTQQTAIPGPSTQEMQLPGVHPEVAGDDDTHPGMNRAGGNAAARGPERATTWQPGVTSEVRPPADLAGPGWAFATTRVAAAVATPGEESLHEEARRLARLLVSEIKLYNEEQVEEGRRSRDIYERLKEDIDRSRQMYEERVDERVRNKTDYFYQELVRILAGSLLLQAGRSSTAQPTPAIPAGPTTLVLTGFDGAANALRGRDCPRALDLLRQQADTSAPDSAAPAAAMARLLRGMYAHACDDPAGAEAALAQAAAPGGALEDWRLLLLSDSAAALGHVPGAQAALARLIEDYPDSPLRPDAVARAAALADKAGDRVRAAELVALGRRQAFDAAIETRLDLLAFAAARRSGSIAEQRDAAKRLLIQSPLEAADVKAAEVFRSMSGNLEWASFLSLDEILARGARLLELGIADGASASLAAAPPGKRDVRWYTLQARALTASKHGVEALRLLLPLPAPADKQQLAALEWERADAARDAAVARRGKGALSVSVRAAYADEARLHLERVADAGGDPRLTARALRQLFTEIGDNGAFEQAVRILKRLKQIDPTDDIGTRFLFNAGWEEYRRGNFTGAIGNWGELIALYPQSKSARGARYWTGRSFAGLGQAVRANEIYRDIASSEVTDFYRRHALARLGSAPAPTEEPSLPRESWPDDPRLARARALTDLGLDSLGLTELDAVAARATPALDPRAAAALRALILSRQGARRESLPILRTAFPELTTARQAVVPDEALRLYYPVDFAESVRASAQSEGLPAGLVFAIIHQESGFDAGAISHAGARGLMQLMNPTGRELARRLGLPFASNKLIDPAFSVRLGTAYFKQLLNMFDGKLELALASYNSGPGRIQRLWRAGNGDLDSFVEDLRPEETKNYVKRILVISDSYRQLYPPPAG